MYSCGAGAAHHPHVGLDPVPAQPATIEDAVIGPGLQLIGASQPLLVAVEGVGVLHRELPSPQHPGPRPRLVPLLRLQVEQHQRQIAIRPNLAGDVVGDALLVRHRQHHRRPLPILELEHLVDPIPPGLLPVLGGLQHRHQHLLTPDPLHLLPHDRFNLAMSPPARRQIRPQPSPKLSHQPGPNHQLVRERLRIGRRILQGGQQRLAQSSHGGNLPAEPSQHDQGPSAPARSNCPTRPHSLKLPSSGGVRGTGLATLGADVAEGGGNAIR